MPWLPDGYDNKAKGGDMPAKQIIGWILFVVGIGGIVANIAVTALGNGSFILVFNTIVCLLFIGAGWQLAHPKEKKVSGGTA